MHENETPPRSPQSETPFSEQIPHSGIHHDERPVETFDRTPLSEAVARGLVNPIPDSAAILTPESGKKNHGNLMIGLSAGIAGAAIAAGAIMGLKVAGESSNAQNAGPAPADPKATSETTPVPVETAAVPEVLTVKSVEIPTGLTPEQLGTTFIQRLSGWDMAGATNANLDTWLNANGIAAADAVANQVAGQNGLIYAEALFGADWRNRPDLNSDLHPYVMNKTKANAASIGLWFRTAAKTDPKDIAPFKTWTTADSISVIASSNGTITENIAITEHNNASQNRAPQLAPGTAALNGDKAVAKVTFAEKNGVMKVTSFDVVKP